MAVYKIYLYLYHKVSRHMRKCSFIYVYKKSTVILASIFTKLKNARLRYHIEIAPKSENK